MSEKTTALLQARQAEYLACAHDHFYLMKFVKTEDEDIGKVRDFPTNYQYLHDFDHAINTKRRVAVLKARRLMVSWHCMMRQLKRAMFAGTGLPDTDDAFRGCVLSVGETEACYLIERAHKVWYRFPLWLRNKNKLVTENKMLMRWEKGGTIQAFPMKRQGPQSFGFTEVLFDEMALQEAAKSTYAGMIPTLGANGTLITVSTPNGKLNFFYDLWTNKDNKYSGLHRIKMNWWLHPEHTEEWLKGQKSQLDDQDFARMYLLSFSHYKGNRVFPEADPKVIVAEEPLKFMPNKPLYMGWDFGYHFPAAVYFQYNNRDQFVFLREYCDYDIGFDKFCQDAFDFRKTISRTKNFNTTHFVDPAGFQKYSSKAESGAACDVHQIRIVFGRGELIRKGALKVGDRSAEGPRLKEMRQLFRLRKDDRASIVVDPTMEVFLEGLTGGYCYPENGGEVPDKNEFSHIQDAGQYGVTGFNRMTGRHLTADNKPRPKRKKDKTVREQLTGLRIGT